MVPKRRALARMRRMAGVLLVTGGDGTFELADAAAFIFGKVDGVRSIGDIAAELEKEYGISFDEAVTDVAEFVGDLAENGIVELLPPGPGMEPGG